MLNRLYKIACEIVNRPSSTITTFGYEIGERINGEWVPVVISPIVFSTEEMAKEAGEKARNATTRAFHRRKNYRYLQAENFFTRHQEVLTDRKI